jgi:VCBS repeat-containing protein
VKKLLSSAFCLFSLFPFASHAQSGIIETIAGNTLASYSGDHGPATNASLNGPHGIDVDPSGNFYITDAFNNRIRKVSPSGIITTIAGTGTPGYSGDGGPATAADLQQPFQAKLDRAGNLYFADNSHHLRKISTAGIINTLAGTGTAGFSGDGGPASAAELNTPAGVALDPSGNIYVADCFNQRVRKINISTGVISTVAGNGSAGYSGDGGPAIDAQLYNPNYLALDATGNLYISDNQNQVIRKVTPSGTISTFAGSYYPGYGGDGGPATDAEINYAGGLTTDAAGNVYIADYGNSRIRQVDSYGIIRTVAGTGAPAYSGDGGPATAAELNQAVDVAFDVAGEMFIADFNNNVIRKIGAEDYAPIFTNGSSQSLFICSGESPTPINTQLTITDPDVGQTETWHTAVAPSHGTLIASYTATSTGTAIIPTGLSYQPTSGYLGSDVFVVNISDGILTTNTTVNVTVATTPEAGAISGPDTVCAGYTVTLTESASHGIWSTSSYSLSDVNSAGVVTGLLPGSDTIIYTVINACGVASAIFPFTINDCGEGVTTINGANHELQLFPDPAEDQINIISPEPIKQISVINVSGQVVLSEAYSASTIKRSMLDISKLPSGIYVVKVNTSGILKFVKM